MPRPVEGYDRGYDDDQWYGGPRNYQGARECHGEDGYPPSDRRYYEESHSYRRNSPPPRNVRQSWNACFVNLNMLCVTGLTAMCKKQIVVIGLQPGHSLLQVKIPQKTLKIDVFVILFSGGPVLPTVLQQRRFEASVRLKVNHFCLLSVASFDLYVIQQTDH